MKVVKKYDRGQPVIVFDYNDMEEWLTEGYDLNSLNSDCGGDYFKIAGETFFETKKLKEELRFKTKEEVWKKFIFIKDAVQSHLREIKNFEELNSWVIEL